MNLVWSAPKKCCTVQGSPDMYQNQGNSSSIRYALLSSIFSSLFAGVASLVCADPVSIAFSWISLAGTAGLWCAEASCAVVGAACFGPEGMTEPPRRKIGRGGPSFGRCSLLLPGRCSRICASCASRSRRWKGSSGTGSSGSSSLELVAWDKVLGR